MVAFGIRGFIQISNQSRKQNQRVNMPTSNLLSAVGNAEVTFKNRVFMAPMTRARSKDHVANDLTATYYAQRASAGLIFTEGTQISSQAVGWTNTPGIHTSEQIAGWKKVTEAVHKAGGLIFAQLWHTGRASHPDFHGGELPVGPSAIPFNSEVFTAEGPSRRSHRESLQSMRSNPR